MALKAAIISSMGGFGLVHISQDPKFMAFSNVQTAQLHDEGPSGSESFLSG